MAILQQLPAAASHFPTNWWDNQSMTTRQVLIIGGIVGLLVSSAVLALIWFGVAGVLGVGNTDLMYVFWPSSGMLLTSWRSTIPGMMITASSVVINCLLYMALAYALLRVARLVRTLLTAIRCLTLIHLLWKTNKSIAVIRAMPKHQSCSGQFFELDSIPLLTRTPPQTPMSAD